jgi:ribose transport system permease protein
MLLSSSVLFVTAIGLTFVLLAGGFDLSIGALLTLSGYVFAWLINSFDLPAMAAMACTVAFGIVVAGVTNGFLIGRLRLSFMVVTLGTMTLFAGLAKAINLASQPILGRSGQADFLQYTFYQGSILGVPIPVAVCVVVFLLAAFVLRFTLFGRDVHAVGGNPAAAQLSGVSVSWTIVAVYAIAGGSAALASVISSSITSSAINTAGDTVMLQAAAAVLVGGTSLRGGSGTVTGTAIGVLFFGVLHQGLQHYNTAWEQIISGAIVAGAALADKVQRDGWASLEIRRPALWRRPRPTPTA